MTTNQATINKLIEMRMTTMAEGFRQQLRDHSLTHLSFEERMSILVDAEYISRKNNRLKRLIKRLISIRAMPASQILITVQAGNSRNRRSTAWLLVITLTKSTISLSWVLPAPANHIWPVPSAWKPVKGITP